MAHIRVIYLDIDTGYFPDLHHGLASLSASVKRAGHYFSLQHLTSAIPAEDAAKAALEGNPDIIGFSLTTNQRKYLDRYSQGISGKSDIMQMAGGIHPTVDPLDVFNSEAIKGVCLGEAEYSLPLLLNRLDAKTNILETPGFWFKADGDSIIRNQLLPLEGDISKLAYPDYSIFDTKRIIDSDSGWMSMLISRGCPYDCTYCCNYLLRNIYPNKDQYVRLPPVDYALNLIKSNLSTYPNIKGVNFSDDLLLFNSKWFTEFIKRYRQEVALPFICNARISSLTEDVSMLLRDAGCILVRIGIESGNESLRRSLLKRNETNAEIIEVFHRLKSLKIPSFSYNILGFPFETEEQMNETLELNKAIQPNGGTCFYFFPYPGTHLYNLCEESGLLLESSKEMSGYFDGISIKLTHARQNICKKIYNNLRLYLLTRSLKRRLGVVHKLLYAFCRVYPDLFIRLFTRRSGFKNILRKIFYKQLLVR